MYWRGYTAVIAAKQADRREQILRNPLMIDSIYRLVIRARRYFLRLETFMCADRAENRCSSRGIRIPRACSAYVTMHGNVFVIIHN